MHRKHFIRTGALLGVCWVVSMSSQAGAKESSDKEVSWKAKDLAPLHAMAHFVERDANDSRTYAWMLNVYVPKVTWEVAGEGPAIKDPRLAGRESWHVKTEVKMVEMNLSMGYPEASQLSEASQNRIVDLKGKRLSMAEAKKRLDDDTPVLLSVNGKMPESFYTQCFKEDTLVVLIGQATPKEFNLLPTAKFDHQ